jgi:hypothetical protein
LSSVVRWILFFECVCFHYDSINRRYFEVVRVCVVLVYCSETSPASNFLN